MGSDTPADTGFLLTGFKLFVSSLVTSTTAPKILLRFLVFLDLQWFFRHLDHGLVYFTAYILQFRCIDFMLTTQYI